MHVVCQHAINIPPESRQHRSSFKVKLQLKEMRQICCHLAKIKVHNGISGDKRGKDCTYAAIEAPENSIHSLFHCILQGPGCKDIFSSELSSKVPWFPKDYIQVFRLVETSVKIGRRSNQLLSRLPHSLGFFPLKTLVRLLQSSQSKKALRKPRMGTNLFLRICHKLSPV